MEIYNKMTRAYEMEVDHRQLINHEGLYKLLQDTANLASCEIDMFFLPLISTCCGLMGISSAITHREKIMFEEPNIIWTCIAAEPGNND